MCISHFERIIIKESSFIVNFAPIMANKITSLSSLQRHRDLLKMEYEYDRKSFEVQSSHVSIPKKISAGICRYPVSLGRSYYNSLNQFVVEINHAPLEDDDHFEYGKIV